ncbi:site-specific integrase [Mesorhizobium sp.]|uniref:site-specific integrase n=1 Tax=Mesorhizobium sp. TaxID=1871066 RepID=UPI0025DD896B|nr:site-specific integrase [Mesorhizobium sp.]
METILGVICWIERSGQSLDTAALRHLLAFLRSQNAIAEEIEADHNPSPVERHVQAYGRYLHHARALSRQTIINCRPVVRDFLNFRFSDGEVSLAQLRAIDVTDFVRKRVSRLNMRRAKIMTTALRSFLSYVHYRGHHVRPGSSGSDRGQLVTVVHSSCDWPR